LEDLFPESRFNSWAIGEVHVIDKKILPNGRRDHFEQSVHFDNLVSQFAPVVRDIAKRCRDSSIGRKWLREFEVHKAAALEKAKAIARGGLSRTVRQSFTDAIAKSLKAMRKVVATRYIGDETRAQLTTQADAVEARITKMLGQKATATDPLLRYNRQTRAAFQRIIALIHECSSTSAAANVLVDRILTRLDEAEQPRQKEERSGKKSRRQR
jgi:molecular chaperone HtpG